MLSFILTFPSAYSPTFNAGEFWPQYYFPFTVGAAQTPQRGPTFQDLPAGRQVLQFRLV